MKPLAARFLALYVPCVLAASIVGVLDLVARASNSLSASVFVLAVALAVGLAMVFVTCITAATAPLKRTAPAEPTVAAALSLVVIDGGFERRAVGIAFAIIGVGSGLMAGSDALILRYVSSYETVLIAYAACSTLAALLPVAVVRLAVWRGRRWEPSAALVWAFLCAMAYHITLNYWHAASPYTVWAALPLILTPAAAAVFCVLRAVPGVHVAVRIGVAALSLGAALVIGSYPARSAAHATLQSGPIFSSSCWQVLALLSDVDGDASTAVLGGSDCAGFDYDRRPTAMEIVANGVDDNCMGGDLTAFEAAPIVDQPPRWRKLDRPPVIIITLDAIRTDALGRVIAGREVTPTMDALVAGAVSFDNAYSVATATDDSVPAIWTGMYPSDWHQYGVYFGVEPTLAELLSDSGYQSLAVIVHPWLQISLFQGFDVVDNALGEAFRANPMNPTGDETTRRALQQLDQRDPAQPVLMWVHYFDAHQPRRSAPQLSPWLGDDSYVHAVHLIDRSIGALLAGVDERGLLDDAVIVLVSDHGEGLGEHHVETHGVAVWESLARVPLVMRLPGVGAHRVKDRVSTVDLLPTLLDYLTVEDVTQRDGRSLMPLLSGVPVAAVPIFLEMPMDDRPAHFAVIDGGMKLSIDLRREAYRLYDLDQDPDEHHNLIEERAADADRLLGLLGRWRDRIYNDRRLERKQARWDVRSRWQPRTLITGP